jgi:hypothetical protein
VSFTVDDVRISDVTAVQRGTGTDRLERAAAIADELAVDSIPSRLSWSIRIRYSSDAPSRVLCTASVLDPDGNSIVTGWISFAAEKGQGSREMLLSPFSAHVAGLYTVRLAIEAPDPMTRELQVAINQRADHNPR